MDITKNTKYEECKIENWSAPELSSDMKHGDMPGDKVSIGKSHIEKANKVFPELLKLLPDILQRNPSNRAVITVCGGSGVGKSEIASLLSYYFQTEGIGSYTLSGDNYPHRIPKYNDAERLRIFRQSGVQGMVKDGEYTMERFATLHEFQKAGVDASEDHVKEYPWYASYLKNGKAGLQAYLGTPNEIAFEEIQRIVTKFKAGENAIWLKRMGREEHELWYEEVDFSQTQILVIEWTHGNSDHYQGVDIPVLLNSTPQETLEHRRSRNRDGQTDSPFTMLVLQLEQEMLESQAHKAKVIVSKQGEILHYEEYQSLMREAKEDTNE